MGKREKGEKVTKSRRMTKIRRRKTRDMIKQKRKSVDDGSVSLQRNQNKFTYIRKQFPEKSEKLDPSCR